MCAQAFRMLLLHGPITANGRCAHLIQYYYKFTKELQTGRSCVTKVEDVVSLVMWPDTQVQHMLLNHALCFVVDAVHWCCLDYAKALLVESKQGQGKVRSSLICCDHLDRQC